MMQLAAAAAPAPSPVPLHQVPLTQIILPSNALPWPILAILLIGFFAVIIIAALKAKQFKTYAVNFPTHESTVIVALALLAMTIPVMLSLIALGIPLPDGAGDILTAECALAGVTVIGLGVKRFSSSDYQQGKAIIEAAKAGAAPTPVNVDGGNVNINNAQPPRAPAAAAPSAPAPIPGAPSFMPDARARASIEANASEEGAVG